MAAPPSVAYDGTHLAEPRHLRLTAERAAEAAEGGAMPPAKLRFERLANGTIRGRCEVCGVEIPVEVA